MTRSRAGSRIVGRVAATRGWLHASRCTVPLALAAVFAAAPLRAQHGHSPAPAAAPRVPAPFVATTAKSFPQLMDDAMAVMDHGMRAAAMNGDPDHDFVSMMIPHHQGAIDMARAVLLHTRDPELRNLALSIVAEQNNEIRLMQAWLARHAQARQGGPGSHARPQSTSTQDTRP